MSRSSTLTAYYKAMLERLGPSGWWPGDTPFEVAVGAVLTQNTNWGNVEKALALLKQRGPLTPAALLGMPQGELEECIRPSGYYRVKAERLRSLLAFMAEAAQDAALLEDASLDFFASRETAELREGLLRVRGIGPETADCILLYALNRPVFVVDAYTLRLLNRHGHVPEDTPYHEMQEYFMDVLPEDAALYNEYHALIVRVGKEYCKKSKPLCRECPLSSFLEYEPE